MIAYKVVRKHRESGILLSSFAFGGWEEEYVVGETTTPKHHGSMLFCYPPGARMLEHKPGVTRVLMVEVPDDSIITNHAPSVISNMWTDNWRSFAERGTGAIAKSFGARRGPARKQGLNYNILLATEVHVLEDLGACRTWETAPEEE